MQPFNWTMIFILLAFPIAMLLEGLRRKLYARMQHRIGPPVLQPFYDIKKLFSKEKTKMQNWLFITTPIIALIIAFCFFLFIPFGWISFNYDFIVFGYAFILLDSIYLIATMSSRTPFGAQAVARDLILMIGYEIVLLIGITIFMVDSGAASLGMYKTELAFMKLPIASLIMVYLGYVIVKVTPYDVVNAEPEISAGMFTEYAGGRLAILEMAEFMKNLAFYVLVGILLVGMTYWPVVAFLVFFWCTTSHAVSPRFSTYRNAKMLIFVACIAFIDLLV